MALLLIIVLQAFSFLREEVKTFLGQPIRARIKGTTVQRSSGMPKKPRVNYPIQPMYNGGTRVSDKHVGPK